MAIASRQEPFDHSSQGKGLLIPFQGASVGNGTAAAAGSGNISAHFVPNNVGTTLWSTIQGIPTPAGLPNPTRLMAFMSGSSLGLTVIYLARAYKIGTLNLAATGNQFTHDSATYPILKNQMGASSALSLIPVLVVSTATTTTAAVFTIKTNAGGAGYVNQDGNNVIGTKTFTMPNVATAVGSSFILRLEDGDSAIQDITQIAVGTAASAGAAILYGLDPFCMTTSVVSAIPGSANAVVNPPSIPNIAAGAATSGTATSLLSVFVTGTSNGTTVGGFIKAYVE